MGTDVVELARVREARRRFGLRYLCRVFTPGELAYCLAQRSPEPHLAARFAAKEALRKALSRGHGMTWLDAEVLSDGGPPSLHLNGEARRFANAIGVARTHLSLSHEKTLAMAVVVLENGAV